MFGAVIFLFVTGACFASEPTCSCSSFHYEEKLLEKMIRQEIMFEKFKEDMFALQNKVVDKLADIENERDKYKIEISEERETFRNEIAKIVDNTTGQMQNYAEDFQILKETLRNDINEETIVSKTEVTNMMNNNTKKMQNYADEFRTLKETLQNDVKEERDASKAEVKEELETLKHEFTNIMSNNTKQMNNHAQEFQKWKDALDADTVAFFSKGVSDTTPSGGQIFIFTTPIINEGNGYNKVTGKFKAPVGGLYKFDLQLCLYHGSSNYINFDIVANNYPVQSGFFRDDDNYKCYTADALVRLQTGGTVWVKCRSCDGTIRQVTGYWNTFSGIRIHA